MTTKEQTDRENFEYCLHVAKEVEAYGEGRVYRCEECGEVVLIDDDDEQEEYTCPHCGATCDARDLEQLCLWDYFNDCFDIEYRVDGQKNYRSVRIMIACGGPNVYIDTASRAVELYWWSDRAECPIDIDICNEIDTIFEEYFDC